MRRPEVKITEATVRAMREQRVFRSSEGAASRRASSSVEAASTRSRSPTTPVQNRGYPSAHGGSSGQAGWEFVEALGLDREAPRVGEEAAALLPADACPSGVDDRRRRRADGAPGARVGRPPDRARPRLRHRSRLRARASSSRATSAASATAPSMNITADPTTPLGLGTFGWDDEGSPARRQPVVEGGLLPRLPRRRETAALIGRAFGGSMRADNWSCMPLVRMTNLHLEPGAGTLEDLLADVDDGLYLCTNKSWSIDDKRLNFQFGTQVAWEIKKGKLGKMLRDPTYMGVTPEFWGGSTPWPGPTSGRCSGSRIAARGNRASTRTSHTERRRHASATSRWAFARDSGARARAERAVAAAEGDEADARFTSRAPGSPATRHRRCTNRP